MLSFVTVGEMLRGALQADWGEPRRTALQARIDAVTILPYDEVVINAHAVATAWAVAPGHPLGRRSLQRRADRCNRGPARRWTGDRQPSPLQGLPGLVVLS
jgi:hypothetical protein